MAPAQRPKIPRALLICCEGKTEEAYFNALLDFFRLPAFVAVEVYGQEGQHYALVDNALLRRDTLCVESGWDERDVECWAVCDEDKLSGTFAQLDGYAEERGVHLAFSAPQFEMYLLQHFEQSGSADRAEVFRRLSVYRSAYGGEGEYGDDTKADLGWMARAIDSRPKIVKVAITNSDLRDRPSRRPFLTVQRLTERIVNLAI